MVKYKVIIDEEAKKDVRLTKDYYNKISPALKQIFLDDLYHSIDSLKINPFFQMRYNNIRCLPLKKFPFMLHFTINEPETTVSVWGLVSTYLNPADTWVYEES
jgi:hypothetical protein